MRECVSVFVSVRARVCACVCVRLHLCCVLRVSLSLPVCVSGQVPKLVSLLAESYNPHVRYGACLAVGIACARTGSAEAVRLLEPMLADVSDFVRQGALLAMAMVLQQESETRNPKVCAHSRIPPFCVW